MSSLAKYLHTAKYCRTVSSLNNITRCLSMTQTNNRNTSLANRLPFNDVATNFIRSMEQEFEWAKRKLDRTMSELGRFDLLPPVSSVVDNDFIETDKHGNRRFRLVFDLREYDPENIKIKTTKDHYMVLSAKKEKKVGNLI
jgi:HSP20 family molecular chaperone IbpA